MHIPSFEYYSLMEDVEQKGRFVSPNDSGTIVNFWVLFLRGPGLRLCDKIISGASPCSGGQRSCATGPTLIPVSVLSENSSPTQLL